MLAETDGKCIYILRGQLGGNLMVVYRPLTMLDNEEIGEVSDGNLYDVLVFCKEHNAQIISPRKEVLTRLNTLGKLNIGLNRESGGTFTSAGIELLKDHGAILRTKSRLLDLNLAEKAISTYRKKEYLSLGEEVYYESLSQAEREKRLPPHQREVIILPKMADYFVLLGTLNFDILEFLIRDPNIARDYFRGYNHGNGIEFIGLHPAVVKKQEGTLLGQLSIGCNDVYGVLRTDIDISATNRMRIAKQLAHT